MRPRAAAIDLPSSATRGRPTEHAANVEQKVGELFGDFAFRFGKFGAVPFRFELDAQTSGAQEVPILLGFVGRGSWIRTNDLQYPKLPRYQAALYPEYPWETTSIHACAATSKPPAGVSSAVKERMRHAVSWRDPVLFCRACNHLEYPLRRPSRGDDLGR